MLHETSSSYQVLIIFLWNFRSVISKLIVVTDGSDIFREIALRWIPLDLIDAKSTSVQVMAWCHQATSHYLSQCWPRFMSPYGITRPQWVNDLFCSTGHQQVNHWIASILSHATTKTNATFYPMCSLIHWGQEKFRPFQKEIFLLYCIIKILDKITKIKFWYIPEALPDDKL